MPRTSPAGWTERRSARVVARVLVAVLGLASVVARGAREVESRAQLEQRDPATGNVVVEASTIHVVACDGPGENGETMFVYEYPSRGFKAVRPGDWNTTLGGREFVSWSEAAAAGCHAPAKAAESPTGAAPAPPPVTPPSSPMPPPLVALPSTMTVLHTNALLWPTTLRLKARGEDFGEYEGTDFEGRRATGRFVLHPDATADLTIQVPDNGYVGTYSGRTVGNTFEGEYRPSQGFGSGGYFRADLGAGVVSPQR